MSRKPAHLLAAAPRPQGRDAIWTAIRALKTFTVLSLEDRCRVKLATIRTYLDGLTAAGILKVVTPAGRDAKGKKTQITWSLVKDAGVEAPRVTRTGMPVTQGNARQQMWRAMRSARAFTHGELAYLASTEDCIVKPLDAKSYVLQLARAGYLAITERGRPAHQTVFRFVKNTGPKAPQIQRLHQVFDPNLKKVMWTSGGAQ